MSAETPVKKSVMWAQLVVLLALSTVALACAGCAELIQAEEDNVTRNIYRDVYRAQGDDRLLADIKANAAVDEERRIRRTPPTRDLP